MSWPKKTWTVNGWEDFRAPGKGKPDDSFPDDWKKHKPKDNSSYWDVINNPLYEAAANASGIDWDQWVTESFAKIGEQDNYEEDDRKRVFKDPKVDEKWAGFSKAQQHIAMGLPEFRMAARYEDGGDSDKYEDTRRNWGIDRGKFGGVAEDLDTMHEWLTKTIKTHSMQHMEIIDRGPQGKDYGIDGDIWEHYGLDKPPTPPKAMDLNYEFNLIEAQTSTATYATPAGYPVLDKSNNNTYKKVSWEDMKDGGADTHYTKWQAEQDQAYDKWEDKWGDTSYGEPKKAKEVRGSARWKANVQKIIGKDQDVTAWANAAGVGTLNSRNDSDTIKAKFRELDGVLPT